MEISRTTLHLPIKMIKRCTPDVINLTMMTLNITLVKNGKKCAHGGKIIMYKTNQQKIDPMKLSYEFLKDIYCSF